MAGSNKYTLNLSEQPKFEPEFKAGTLTAALQRSIY
jgi:hypothetical protein